MLSSIGTGEIILILIIALFVVGPDRLPGLAKSAGKLVARFRKSLRMMTDEIRDAQDDLGSLSGELNQAKKSLDQAVTGTAPRDRPAGEEQQKEVATEEYGQDRHH